MSGERSSTPTPSLRRRVIVATLVLLTALLAILGVTVDQVVGSQARRSLHDRLMATATRADALVSSGLPPADVVAQVGGGGIRARLLTAGGASYGDPALSEDADQEPPPPPPPPVGGAPPPPPPPAGAPKRPPPERTSTAIVHRLPDGDRLVLVADTTATTELLTQLRTVIVVSAVIVLAVAAAGLVLLVGLAVRPLQRLTGVAHSIASGDRGRRLNPDRPATELGSAATAFDEMLDALEASEQRARDAAVAAERADAATRDFLADAAHELRTPIAGIHAGAQQIAAAATQHGDDPDADAQRRRAELVLADARRAGRLVADMLDLSRIDAGHVLEPVQCDLVTIAEAECARAATLAPAIHVQRSGDASARLLADPVRLGQIIANLADNARRHTPPGGVITVDVRSDGPTVVLTVTDTGTGVPADQRERIFERLVRLDDARSRDHGGAGLGLPIARALARAHGGNLDCADSPVGARFVLVLPTTPPQHGATTARI